MKQEECNCGQSGNKSSCNCADGAQTNTQEKSEQNASCCQCAREYALQEVYRTACTGKESAELLKKFSQDKAFTSLLIKQYKAYDSLAKDIEIYANDNNIPDLRGTSAMAKGMMYVTTAVNTLTDKSDSKLSEIMLQGINMGDIAMVKLKNCLDENSREYQFADEMLELLTRSAAEMKMFL